MPRQTVRAYIGNIPFTTDETAVRRFLGDGSLCTVKDVYLAYDQDRDRPRGFAFVELASAAEVAEAIARCDGQDFGGRRAVVSEARERSRGRERFRARRLGVKEPLTRDKIYEDVG